MNTWKSTPLLNASDSVEINKVLACPPPEYDDILAIAQQFKIRGWREATERAIEMGYVSAQYADDFRRAMLLPIGTSTR